MLAPQLENNFKMNTENKIPAPRITYPAKATLKRKSVVTNWYKISAAAVLLLAVGLGYFLGQWSPPLTTLVAQETVTPTTPTHDVVTHQEPSMEQSPKPKPSPKPEPKVSMPIPTKPARQTRVEMVAVTSQYAYIDIKVATESISPRITAMELVSERQESVTVQIIIIDKPNSIFPNFGKGEFFAQYGDDVRDPVLAVPKTLVALAKSYTVPFTKKEK